MRRLAIALGGLLLARSACSPWERAHAHAQGDAADGRGSGRHRRGQRAGRRRGGRRSDQGDRPRRDGRRAGARRADEHARAPSCRRSAWPGWPRPSTTRRCRSRIWVGPSGSRALGLTGQLLGAAAVTAMAPGTRIGDFGDPAARAGLRARLRQRRRPAPGRSTHGPDRGPGAQRAAPDHLDQGVPVLRNMLLAIDGLEYQGTTLEHGRGASGRRRQGGAGAGGRAPLLQAALAAPPHAHRRQPAGRLPPADDRPVAPDLRDLHRRGRRGRRRRARLPRAGVLRPRRAADNGWALALLFVAFFGLAVDVQTGVPRVWTGIGLALYAGASWFLFRTACGCRGSRCWPGSAASPSPSSWACRRWSAPASPPRRSGGSG